MGESMPLQEIIVHLKGGMHGDPSSAKRTMAT